jgi:cytoskeletal protein CcmA (bactofilin family)
MSTKIWKDFEILNEQHWIAADFRGRGEMHFRGQLRFSGTWLGSIRSDDPEACLFVLKGARMEGLIEVANVIVGGDLVDVNLQAKVFEALAGSRVSGCVRAGCLRVEEGALLEGEITSLSTPGP